MKNATCLFNLEIGDVIAMTIDGVIIEEDGKLYAKMEKEVFDELVNRMQEIKLDAARVEEELVLKNQELEDVKGKNQLTLADDQMRYYLNIANSYNKLKMDYDVMKRNYEERCEDCRSLSGTLDENSKTYQRRMSELTIKISEMVAEVNEKNKMYHLRESEISKWKTLFCDLEKRWLERVEMYHLDEAEKKIEELESCIKQSDETTEVLYSRIEDRRPSGRPAPGRADCPAAALRCRRAGGSSARRRSPGTRADTALGRCRPDRGR